MAPVLIEALPGDRLSEHKPRAVTAADLASASQVIAFNLAADELPILSPAVERWDDVPSLSENLRSQPEIPLAATLTV